MAGGSTGHLVRVWGSGPRDVFATGMGGSILHYDGVSWKPMASGTNVNLYGVWGSSDRNVFAVGPGGTILRYSGPPAPSKAAGQSSGAPGR
jgi:photosystem II stability/assembly factor-like uncharacterized protein